MAMVILFVVLFLFCYTYSMFTVLNTARQIMNSVCQELGWDGKRLQRSQIVQNKFFPSSYHEGDINLCINDWRVIFHYKLTMMKSRTNLYLIQYQVTSSLSSLVLIHA